MVTKEDIYKKLIRKRKEKIDDFDIKVLTSVMLKKFFGDKKYDFFFTPTITLKSNQRKKRPDYLIKKDGYLDILGEIKQSLPDTNGDHFKNFLDETIKQLKDYLKEFIEVSSPHDLFIASNQRYNMAMSELIDKIESDNELKKKVIFLKYFWNSGTSHRSLVLQKIYGTFTDLELEDELKNGRDHMMGQGDLDSVQGSYKLFYTEEEFNAPIEYVMTVLWFNVFPELANSSSKDKAIERIKHGTNTLKFNLDEIWGILKKYYVLASFPNRELEQFNKKMLTHCMNAFVSLKKAKVLEAEESNNPNYSITFTKFPTKNELIEYFIEELNGKKFKEQAEIEYKSLVNKQLG